MFSICRTTSSSSSDGVSDSFNPAIMQFLLHFFFFFCNLGNNKGIGIDPMGFSLHAMFSICRTISSSSSDGVSVKSPPAASSVDAPIEQMLNIMDTSLNHGNSH